MYNLYNQVFSSMTYLLLPGGLDPGQALPSFLLHPLFPLLVRRPTRIGASGHLGPPTIFAGGIGLAPNPGNFGAIHILTSRR